MVFKNSDLDINQISNECSKLLFYNKLLVESICINGLPFYAYY